MPGLALIGLIVGLVLIVTDVVLSFLPPRDDDKEDSK